MCNAWRCAKHFIAESKRNPNARLKESIMKMFPIAVIGAGALAAVSLGLAGPASAAGGADDVINGLKADGYSVQVNGAPSANLSACTVSSVKKDSAGEPTATAYVDIACPTGC
jgi:hypothetical protein